MNCENKNKIHTKCKRCGRKLKDKDSQIIGYGKVCYKKHIQDTKYKKLIKREKQ